MGGWWAVHENGPSDKYRHYYYKTKYTHTQNSTLIRDGDGRVMKMVPMSHIATTTRIERKKCVHTHTHTHTPTTTTTKITPHTSIYLFIKKTTQKKHNNKQTIQTKQKPTTAYAEMDHNNGRRSTYNGRIVIDCVKHTT